MSSRVRKQTKPSSRAAARRAGELLRAFSSEHSILMPSCGNCARRGLSSCRASPQDTSRCEECVLRKRAGCDVLGISEAQLQSIAQFNAKFDREVNEAAAEVALATAKFQRLQKQKALWAGRLMTAFQRGLNDVEELEAKEREEAEEERRRNEQSARVDTPLLDWSAMPEVALSPGLLADLGIPENVETLPDSGSNS